MVGGGGSANLRISTTEPVTVNGFELTNLNIDSYAAGAQIVYRCNVISGLIENMYFGDPLSYLLLQNHVYGTAAGWDAVMMARGYDGGSSSDYQTSVNIESNVFDNAPTATGLNLSNVQGTVANNTFSGLEYYAILLANDTYTTISGNTFKEITNPDPSVVTCGAGIRFYAPSDPELSSDNRRQCIHRRLRRDRRPCGVGHDWPAGRHRRQHLHRQ